MDKTNLHKQFEEGRRFPRIRIATQVSVLYEAGKVILADIFDISPEGLQIRCTEGTALQLHPCTEFIRESERRTVSIQFTLPVAKRRKTIMANAKICYMIVLDDANPPIQPRPAALGLKFGEFKGRSHKHLKTFLFNKNIYQTHWADIEGT